MKKLNKSKFLFACALTCLAQAQTQRPARPPQYIALAFDGSKTISAWEQTRSFSKSLRDNNKHLAFSYFLSGVVFLKDTQKRLYTGPKHSAGQSDITFGGDTTELTSRIQQINAAIDEGHEMGSHANGHFHAEEQSWSEDDWMSEFSIFNKLIKNVFVNNGLPDSLERLKLNVEEDVVGFRAPYLETTNGLWPTLREFKYRYDTSRVADANYWPRKVEGGVWNFPLAMLRIVDTNKRTLSMDYNFYVADSNAEPNPSQSEVYRDRMKRTYLKYFESNYNGNRAPLHIGHHFSAWNGAAYWNALKDFASEVCGKPEVKCVTYKELANYMDTLSEATIAAYQRGNFDTSNAPPSMKTQNRIFSEAKVYSSQELKNLGLEVDPPKAHQE